MKNNTIFKNISMLMLLNIAKLVFPFFTLPYLTRVLSTDCYGIVAYVKAVMAYMQVAVDFGFTLSATKMVVEKKNNKADLEKVVSINLFSRIILALMTFVGVFLLALFIPLLRKNFLFTLLSFCVVFLTVFLFDFLFRGLEKMHIITVRFVIMKTISTVLTFTLVKDDKDVLLIPILDILGSIIVIIWILIEIKKMGIKISWQKFEDCWIVIKESSIYFVSNVASTSFNVFNTLVSGIVLTTTEIAYWSVCMQVINAIQALYIPISDAVYPEMIRSKNIQLIKRLMGILTPVISFGCIFLLLSGRWILYVLGGEKYVAAVPVLKGLIPVVFFGFGSVILGWPSLGAIAKIKETTFSTIFASLVQIFFIVVLLLINRVTLLSMAFSRSIAEICLFSMRYYFVIKFQNEFYNRYS